MSRQIPWFERSFPASTDARLSAEVIARVAGAPARAAEIVRCCSASRLTERVNGAWSIQENIGHLADLDRILFMPRLEQFAAGDGVLLAADVINATTNGAEHNRRGIDDVLDEFQTSRGRIVDHLDALDPVCFADSALHERLGVKMRLIDLCVFIAEHDDSHFARVRELLTQI